MEIYPKAKVETETVEYTPEEKQSVANEFVRLKEEGPDPGYFPIGVDRQLKDREAAAIANINVIGDRKYYPCAIKLIAEIEQEAKDMKAVRPADCKDEAEYKSELAKKKTYLDETTYFDAVLAHNGVEDFAELKTALTPKEIAK